MLHLMTDYQLAKTLGTRLQAKQWQLVTAESCTGGGLAAALTAVPGSSAWFWGGWVSYHNDAKQQWLSVPPTLLSQYGAVSSHVASAMVEGALQHSPAHVAIAITGIAGPTGGSPEKPVGTVWFAWGVRGERPTAHHERFSGTRAQIRKQAVRFALEKLVEFLA